MQQAKAVRRKYAKAIMDLVKKTNVKELTDFRETDNILSRIFPMVEVASNKPSDLVVCLNVLESTSQDDINGVMDELASIATNLVAVIIDSQDFEQWLGVLSKWFYVVSFSAGDDLFVIAKRKRATMEWRWEWVAALANERGWQKGAELGVKEGRFTSNLMMNVPGLSMIAVDLWEAQPGNDAKECGETYENWPNQRYYEDFSQAMKIYGDRVSIHRMFTHEAAKLVDDESLDFVFIDADHSYEGVSRDIADWTPKVRKGGAVIGHDWPWPTVQRAVKDHFDESRVVLGANKCWMVTL